MTFDGDFLQPIPYQPVVLRHGGNISTRRDFVHVPPGELLLAVRSLLERNGVMARVELEGEITGIYVARAALLAVHERGGDPGGAESNLHRVARCGRGVPLKPRSSSAATTSRGSGNVIAASLTSHADGAKSQRRRKQLRPVSDRRRAARDGDRAGHGMGRRDLLGENRARIPCRGVDNGSVSGNGGARSGR